MKSKLSDILKKIFLSSMAGIATNTTAHTIPAINNTVANLNEKDLSVVKQKDLSPKLLLKLNKGSDYTLVSHRSHRSHSSHRSHYSSSTGSNSSTSRSSGSSSNSSGSSSSGSSSSSSSALGLSNSGSSKSSSSATQKTSTGNLSGLKATALKLGDRNLKKGMVGTDVTELINILLKKNYLQLEDGGSQVDGSYSYDETIEATVKRYQIDNNLTADGNCGPATVYHLLKK